MNDCLRKLLLALSLVALVPSRVLAAEWEKVGSLDKPAAEIAIDKTSVSLMRTGLAKAWFRTTYKEPQTNAQERKYLSSIDLVQVNCADMSMGRVQSNQFADAQGKEPVAMGQTEIVRFVEPAPDSLDRAMVAAACSRIPVPPAPKTKK